ncbi:hypothetical protein K9N68_08370 [Kovacikia minuta CCNUW1]|uniref:hypothetical protein n=1 Tax=Kovacikia minuta TaxID=2931930 RepID=UPI001CC960CB|nr:hypothetical protein [Kovacikia minuta]UBF27897.1 hypothetical protein K9N68_08370 [Kovacikia minuta CCNUW1]
MKGYWKSAFVKTTIWLAAEVLLTVVGLDNLADYSEFVFAREGQANGAIASNVTVLLR